MTEEVTVSLRVTCANDTDVPAVVEKLGRVGSGWALDGFFVALFIDREEPEEPCKTT